MLQRIRFLTDLSCYSHPSAAGAETRAQQQRLRAAFPEVFEIQTGIIMPGVLARLDRTMRKQIESNGFGLELVFETQAEADSSNHLVALVLAVARGWEDPFLPETPEC